MGHLAKLQETLRPQAWLLVPRTDAFQGEYVAPQDERLAWVSGFTGTAGIAVVSQNRAVLFVDGRYTIQARDQVDSSWEVLHIVDKTLATFLTEVLDVGHTLKIDAWLHTLNDYKELQAICDKRQATIELLAENPIDTLWHDRPQPGNFPIQPHALTFTGETSKEKCHRLIKDLHADRVLLTNCDAIAWLLNIRGQDLPYTPTVQAYALLNKDETVDLFVSLEKVTPTLQSYLGDQVRFHAWESLTAHLEAQAGQSIALDPHQTPVILTQLLKKNPQTKLVFQQDPCILPKALKNPAEVTGAMAAHVRDGVALVRFLAWLEAQPTPEGLTELDCAEKLLAYRQEGDRFRALSFPTISSAGPHGAIVHYQPTIETNRHLDKDNLFLLDSGAQYLDGTTDVTRTVVIGTPTHEHCYHTTLVLKGHIALASARFPKGTTGSQLDILARQPLWQAGLEYTHGTGHGVGSYLSVHEGPQRIGRAYSAQPMLPGMLTSNEPGYYRAGAYGIRIESIVLVREQIDRPNWYEFQTLTLVPIDRRLILPELLLPSEREWLNQYHFRVYETLCPFLDEPTLKWLKQATAAI